ncbi:MAG: hypothetical protein ACJA2W_001943 [Planctomycetota bacterium]|jgi:hypothetical protein
MYLYSLKRAEALAGLGSQNWRLRRKSIERLELRAELPWELNRRPVASE